MAFPGVPWRSVTAVHGRSAAFSSLKGRTPERSPAGGITPGDYVGPAPAGVPSRGRASTGVAEGAARRLAPRYSLPANRGARYPLFATRYSLPANRGARATLGESRPRPENRARKLRRRRAPQIAVGIPRAFRAFRG